MSAGFEMSTGNVMGGGDVSSICLPCAVAGDNTVMLLKFGAVKVCWHVCLQKTKKSPLCYFDFHHPQLCCFASSTSRCCFLCTVDCVSSAPAPSNQCLSTPLTPSVLEWCHSRPLRSVHLFVCPLVTKFKKITSSYAIGPKICWRHMHCPCQPNPN